MRHNRYTDCMKFKGMTMVALLAVFLACKNEKKQTVEAPMHTIALFDSQSNDDVACYRIPAIITTTNGTLIAAIDERVPSCNDLRDNRDINIVIRRSADHGLSWSPITSIVDYPYGESASDPSLILDSETGEIFLFYNYMDLETAPDQYLFKVVRSKDHGKSWSKPEDITTQISPENSQMDFQFITSGRGIQTQSGTLLHTLVNLEKGLFVFGSNDHGQSWYHIPTPISPGDESKIVELSNGRWMINSRVNKSGLRFVHTSNDQGNSWESRADSTLIDPACNASILRYDKAPHGKNLLLFSNPSSKDKRENLTLKFSEDEGTSWKPGRTITTEMSAYSTMSVLNNGNIGLLYEAEDYQKNVFTSIPMDWLMESK
nr:sialidase family protein [Allomuricauda sp.]